MEKNKHGLDRYIPEEIRRNVRKRCGFGCVECGSAIYQYHHFNPSFEEAKTHDPNGITLLCGSSHEEVHRGLLSNDSVSFYNSNPKCLSEGFSRFTSHGLGSVVVLGTSTFTNTPNIIVGFGQSLLVIEPPEEQSAPFRVSALFQDKFGKEIARIDQNEWKGSSDNWDIQTSGTRFTIRQAPRSIDLEINMTPEELIIEKLNMFYKEYRIICNEEGATFYFPNSSRWFTANGATISGCSYGIAFG